MKFFSSFFGGGRKPKRDHSSRGKKLIDENGERDASLGRTDESNNYGDEEHLHKCLSERERERGSTLKKLGRKTKKLQVPVMSSKFFASPRLGGRVCETLIGRTFFVKKRGKEGEGGGEVER